MKKKLIIIGIIVLVLIGGFFCVSRILKSKSLPKTILGGDSILSPVYLKEDGTPRFISGDRVKTIVKNESDAFLALKEISSIYGIKNAEEEFMLLNLNEYQDMRYYRFQQIHRDVEVEGNQLIVGVNKDNNVTSVSGNYTPNIDINPLFFNESQVKLNFLHTLDGEYDVVASTLKIYPNKDEPILTLNIIINSAEGEYSYFVDKDCNIIDKISVINYANYVYNGDDGIGNKITVELKEESEDTYSFVDENRNIKVYNTDLVAGYNPISSILLFLTKRIANPIETVKRDNNIYIKNDEKNTALIKNAASNLYLLQKTYDYYYDVLGRKSYDGNGGEIQSFIDVQAHYTDDDVFDNSAWKNGQHVLFFGMIEGTSMGSLIDIVAHEFTHGVTQYTSGLKEEGQSGAINEGYSDIFALLIKNKGFIILPGYEASRNAEDPNATQNPKEVGGKYYFPNDTETYNDQWVQNEIQGNFNENDINNPEFVWQEKIDSGGIHLNSTIVSHAAYLMYQNGAFENKDEMARVFYNSQFIMTPTSDFNDCALAVIASARNLLLEEDKIQIIIDAFVETKMLSYDKTTISGVVSDADTNKPISDAHIILTSIDNPLITYETYTDKKGRYTMTNILSEEYTVVVQKGKYENYHKDNNFDEKNTTLDITLKKLEIEQYDYKEIMFVVDISQSMYDSDPTDIRKQIMAGITSSLSDSYGLGLVIFNRVPTSVSQKVSFNQDNRQKLIADLFNIVNDNGRNSMSGTVGSAGLEAALKQFSDKQEIQRYIIFLTDGVDTEYNKELYESVISSCNEKNIRIISVGLGEGELLDESTLKELADKTQGKYFHANVSADLYKYNKTILEEIA